MKHAEFSSALYAPGSENREKTGIPGPAELSRRENGTELCLLLAICLLFAVNVSFYFDFTADDAGITFRYAVNLFSGRGLTYNPGVRVEGYSNFGYVVLSGLVYKAMQVFLSDARPYLVFVMKLLNIAAATCAIILCYCFVRKKLGKPGLSAISAALLLSVNGAFVINTSSPLETSTYTLLLMCLVYQSVSPHPGSKKARGSSDMLFLLTAIVFSLWRIDAPLLAGVVLATGPLVRGARKMRRQVRIGVAWFGVYLVYTVARFSYFGNIFPNPFYSKIAVGFHSPLRTEYTNLYFTHLGDNALIFLALFAFAAMLDFKRYLLPFLLIAAQWIYISMVGGDWMTGFRFWAPLTPCMCILIVAVFDRPFRNLSRRMEQIMKAILFTEIAFWWCASTVTMYGFGGKEPVFFWKDLSSKEVVRLNPYWETARWLRSHANEDAVMAVAEGGYLPFLTGLTTIDTYGLCDPALARMPGTRGRLGLSVLWMPGDPGTGYILRRRPDLIVYGPEKDNLGPCWMGKYLLVKSFENGMHVYMRKGSSALKNRSDL